MNGSLCNVGFICSTIANGTGTRTRVAGRGRDEALPPRPPRPAPGEDVIGADWEPPAWEDTPAGRPGEPSPHLKPGEKSWVEVEAGRRRKGRTPRHGLPDEPPLPHEIPPDDTPKPTGTGLFYKSGREIPPTHPDHGPMHLLPRQEDGSFSAYYYCSKQELADFEIPAPPPRRHRRDGFDSARQEAFIRHLRDTGSITDAAHLTGISRSTVYNLLNSPDAGAFRDAVAEALKGVDVLLEATAIERAVNGQEEIVYYQGRRVGVRWKYDNRLLMSLLRARNPLKYAPLSEIEGWLQRRARLGRPMSKARPNASPPRSGMGHRLPGEDLLGEPPRSSRPPVAMSSISSLTQNASAPLCPANGRKSGHGEGAERRRAISFRPPAGNRGCRVSVS